MSKKNSNKNEILKGILIGYLLSAEMFKDQLEPSFESKLNASRSLIKAGLISDIISTFSESSEDEFKELYNWTIENFDIIVNEDQIEFLRYRIKLMITKIDLTAPPSLN
jgi:hypothetical protein